MPKAKASATVAAMMAGRYMLGLEAPPIFVASGGSKSAALAGRVGDGLIGTSFIRRELTISSATIAVFDPQYDPHGKTLRAGLEGAENRQQSPTFSLAS